MQSLKNFQRTFHHTHIKKYLRQVFLKKGIRNKFIYKGQLQTFSFGGKKVFHTKLDQRHIT